MSLVTAHKILIGSAIAFFAFLGMWTLRDYSARGAIALLWSALCFGAAVGFGAYLRTVKPRPHPRNPRSFS